MKADYAKRSEKLRVVCAAVRFPLTGGAHIVIPSVRHMDGFMRAILAEFRKLNLPLDESREIEQGFLTNGPAWEERFVSRDKALKIAFASGQIASSIHEVELFSEDLY